MQYILYKNSKVAYSVSGQGTCLILLHGFCEDSTMWADFVSHLSKSYQVLTIDLSGFGNSDLLEHTSMEEMAHSVAFVLKMLNIEKCILTGHSMGGYVGLAFAEYYPDLLLGLGLFHSHPYADGSEKIVNRKKTIRFVERHGVSPFAGQFVRNLFAADFVKNNPVFVEDLIHKTSTHHSDAVVAASHAMINRKDCSNILTKLACPALFIVGVQDNAIELKQSLTQLSLPKVASIHIFETIGHMGMFEAPQQCLNIVHDFVDFCVAFAE